ncbi:LysR family transcriptional regulator [Labrys miyagiensis]
MKKPDFTTLRIFLTVHRLGNISKAAEYEHIASSAISKRIQTLEAEMGAPLFYRHSRGVTATPAGETLARHALTLFDSLNRMTADMSSFVSGVAGQVLIHSHTSAIIEFLAPQLASFSAKYPDVKVILREDTSTAVVQSTVEGISDIGIFGGNIETPDTLNVIRYKRDRLVALLPAGHQLADRETISFEDLRDFDHISLATGSSLQKLQADMAQACGFVVRTRIEVKTFEPAIRMVEAGLGIAIIPDGVLRDERVRPEVRVVQLSNPWATRQHLICTRNGRQLTAAAALLLKHICES